MLKSVAKLQTNFLTAKYFRSFLHLFFNGYSQCLPEVTERQHHPSLNRKKSRYCFLRFSSIKEAEPFRFRSFPDEHNGPERYQQTACNDFRSERLFQDKEREQDGEYHTHLVKRRHLRFRAFHFVDPQKPIYRYIIDRMDHPCILFPHLSGSPLPGRRYWRLRHWRILCLDMLHGLETAQPPGKSVQRTG